MDRLVPEYLEGLEDPLDLWHRLHQLGLSDPELLKLLL
jgi:hypothetical protein